VFYKNVIRNSPIVVYSPSADALENWSPTPYSNVTFTNNFIYSIEGVLSAQKGSLADSTGLLLTRNVFADVGRFILVHPNTTIEHNTFLRVSEASWPGVSRASHPIRVTTGGTNIVLRNNAFVDCGEPLNSITLDLVGWYEVINLGQILVAEGNFVTGPAPAYAAKTGWPESGSLNGGNPRFVNMSDLLGPDGLPFTDDDGLRLLAGSPLIGAGTGGADIGAYPANAPIALLNIARTNDQIRLYWPETPDSWILEAAPTITGEWAEVLEVPQASDNQLEVTVEVDGMARFFRLRR
jgi:hypothetical protein